MTSSADHGRRVVDQFGPRAQAYVESADHAQGADLVRLAALAEARRGCRVLDLGCGGGHVGFAVAPFARDVVAYDLSAEMLAAVRAEAARRGLANVRTEQGDAAALPFADGAFDLVLTRFSAHHWPDIAASLSEMRRVLAADGCAVVVDTVAPEDPQFDALLNEIELLRDPSHLRDRTVAEWRDAMRGAGLAPGAPVMGRLRLAFAPWIARVGTPPAAAQAIRAAMAKAPAAAATHFAFEADGTFTLDTMLLEATR